MKAIILGVSSAVIAVTALAAPAGATGGFYLAGNSSAHSSGYSRIGIKDGKFFIEGESIFCHTSNSAIGMNFGTGGMQANMPQANVPSADNPCGGGNAGEVINNPPANSTVTINGVCGDPAELAKIKAANANLIINSVGPCPVNPTTPAPQPTIVVNVNVPTPDVKTASATVNSDATSNPKGGAAVSELPQTGISPVVPAAAAGLAALTYAGGMAIRAFRARA